MNFADSAEQKYNLRPLKSGLGAERDKKSNERSGERCSKNKWSVSGAGGRRSGEPTASATSWLLQIVVAVMADIRAGVEAKTVVEELSAKSLVLV